MLAMVEEGNKVLESIPESTYTRSPVLDRCRHRMTPSLESKGDAVQRQKYGIPALRIIDA